MSKQRIDKVLVERGLAESRTRAQALVLAGQVLVREQRIDKPGQLVESEDDIRIKGGTLRYASRGGLKLEAALHEFAVDPEGKNCLDVGASTGGFTDCLLQHGAARVWAIDVGHNQLAWRLRQDPPVVALEGQNARQLKPECDCVALIKPQFEVGKGEVGRNGIVTDRSKHKRVLIQINDAAKAFGLCPCGLIESPILGADGNRDFLMHLRPGAQEHSSLVSVVKQIDLLCG